MGGCGPGGGSRPLSSLAMRRRPNRAHPRVAGPLATLLALAAALACPAGALAASAPDLDGGGASAGQARAGAAAVARYWTPQRMRDARPLDLALGKDGGTRLRAGAPAEPVASASFVPVATPEVPPYSVNGRVFIRRGNLSGFCSGTAINSPTRQLVLTAGHCVNSGREGGRPSVWSNYLEFVPAYTGGVAPFGAFVARRNTICAPKQWIKQGNPDFDMGAFLTFAQLRRGQRRRRGRRRRHDRHRPQPPPDLPDLRLPRRDASRCRAARPPTSATTSSPTACPARRRWRSAATGPRAPAAAAG